MGDSDTILLVKRLDSNALQLFQGALSSLSDRQTVRTVRLSVQGAVG